MTALAAGIVCSIGLQHATAGDIPVAGALGRVRDTDGIARRSTQFRLVDGGIDLTGIDPTASGATVDVFSQTGPLLTLSLPAENWQAVGSTHHRFRFRSSGNARVRSRLVDGQLIQIFAGGARSYALGAPQERVVVRMTIGDKRFCAEFGGSILVDDGTRFTAVRAAAPIACPEPGEQTTTSTTTTSTTETSTTDVSTTTTTETTTTDQSTTTTTSEPYCGDGQCLEPEDATSCYQDCGACGDGICTDGYENDTSCYDDCGSCGDGICTVGYEDASSCYTDCGSCGDGICTQGEENDSTCYTDCGYCGDGICTDGEEDASSCYDDCGSCGDGICTTDIENADSCYADCGFCGDFICTVSDEDESTCYEDCGYCGDGICHFPEENSQNCYTDCFSGS